MFKLVKYDLQGYFKDFLIMISAIVILNVALFTRVNVWNSGSILALNMAIGFAAEIIVVIWNVKLFSRDIREDTSILLFTLPKSGKNILMNKIVTALIQMVVVQFVIFIFTAMWIQIFKVVQGGVIDIKISFIQFIKNINPKFALFTFLAILVIYVTFLLTVYISITLSKVAIKNRKFGKLGSFIIFVILCIAQGKIAEIFSEAFPQTFKLKVLNLDIPSVDPNNVVANGIDINIVSIFVSVAVLIGLFYATAYLIENKLDL
ncbi:MULTISPECIES: hypothetical protein [Clostridium]|uniref:ABC-2 family transporter protein n=3 Tax=Clostridium TaxID=1485 RepID=D8GLZ5_CLOLD|nr:MULTISPECIES: hypothetical protein [Clostridium]ADK15569.1 putative membrane protein [Clostridium ljungdahlii DSM 13528]AGY74808.1 hypothetical protein CAETHG_0579 [Clostridium autoethanogenum DSM 10061]ALU34986.1 ABC-type transport system permease component [Clostridium autoethanogenum DSM 10061]OAA85425.1 ABC-2 family transporter protein [Clostridium ljungdahlii DSM 13528]OVY51624.1 ABC-2 family transporter protein [Clostridium autoethanogenum]